MSSTFIFPNGIRFATEAEIPDNEHKAATLEHLQSANIQAGYVLAESKNPNNKYYGEMNVSAPEIWNVFEDLCRALIKDTGSVILGDKNEDEKQLFYGPSQDREHILSTLSPYQFELAHDCFIQFGIIHQDVEDGGKVMGIDEIFVHPSKYIAIWTNDDAAVRSLMRTHEIPLVERLSFIDEYPRVTVYEYPGRTREYRQVLTEMKLRFPGLHLL